MKSINKVQIMGRAGQDVQLKNAGNNTIANFGVATSKSWKKGDEWQEETQWHNISAFNAVADRCKDIRKGDIVLVEGELRYRKYTDQNGVEKSVTDINAYGVTIMERYKPAQTSAPEPNANPYAGHTTAAPDPFAPPAGGPDDFPF